MKHSPILPYVQTGTSQELRDVQTVMGHFPDPTLCADGTAPGDLGCSNNDETFSDPTLCADGTAPGDLGCSNNDETFSDPTLCADGTQPGAQGCPNGDGDILRSYLMCRWHCTWRSRLFK